MLSEALARRAFPALVLALIALSAYFEASGLVQLASVSFLETDPDKVAGGPSPDASK